MNIPSSLSEAGGRGRSPLSPGRGKKSSQDPHYPHPIGIYAEGKGGTTSWAFSGPYPGMPGTPLTGGGMGGGTGSGASTPTLSSGALSPLPFTSKYSAYSARAVLAGEEGGGALSPRYRLPVAGGRRATLAEISSPGPHLDKSIPHMPDQASSPRNVHSPHYITPASSSHSPSGLSGHSPGPYYAHSSAMGSPLPSTHRHPGPWEADGSMHPLAGRDGTSMSPGAVPVAPGTPGTSGASGAGGGNTKLAKLLGVEGGSMAMALTPPVEEAKPWFLKYDYEAREVTFNMENQLTGGTLRALVERLTLHDATIDPEFASAFLLTFRAFVDPVQLVTMLRARFLMPFPEGLSRAEIALWEDKKLSPVRIR